MDGSTPRTPAELPLPPGSTGLPLLGETLEFLRSSTDFIDRRIARHGKVFASHLLGKRTVFLLGAEANHWIFAGEGEYLENEWSPAVQKLLGETCLSLISGEEHKRRRKLLAPHFKRTIMSAAIPAVEQVTRRHLARWSTDAELGPLTIFPRMRALTFEIAATYLLGDPGDIGVPLQEFSRDFEAWVDGMFTPAPLALPFTRFAKAMQARERLFRVIDDLVMRRDAEDRRGPDVLSTLLEVRDEAGELLPRDTVVDELQLLLFAGHDTTVSAASNAIFHLSQHPEVAGEARAEQAELDGPGFTLERIRAMPYLEAVIKESMRLIPPIGGAFRVMLRDESFAGFRVPKGWRVAVGPRGAHREAEHWANPEVFDPQRWLDGVERPPFAYIPFGGGPRVCLGQHFAMLELHVVLASILRKLDWELVPGQDLSFELFPLPRPRSGLIVDASPRRE